MCNMLYYSHIEKNAGQDNKEKPKWNVQYTKYLHGNTDVLWVSLQLDTAGTCTTPKD